jgi:hypothetical protein
MPSPAQQLTMEVWNSKNARRQKTKEKKLRNEEKRPALERRRIGVHTTSFERGRWGVLIQAAACVRWSIVKWFTELVPLIVIGPNYSRTKLCSRQCSARPDTPALLYCDPLNKISGRSGPAFGTFCIGRWVLCWPRPRPASRLLTGAVLRWLQGQEAGSTTG